MDLTPRDDYALEIRQGTVVNYSNRFAVLPGRGHPPVKVTAKLANPSRILPPRLTSRSTPPTTIHHTSTHATSTTTNKPNRPSIASKPYPTPHFTTCPAPLNALFIIPSPLKAHPAIRFAVRCNVDYPGNDIRALHASNLQACMHWCAEEKDCKGVSFLHDRVQGKKQHKYKSEIRQRGNCWLKRSVEGNGKGSDWGVDSAKVL
ncbi:MAG: hypothetical protein M1833_006494 [Piccolia ochrophora]|nr:MAG: hypothetical protein M1833_006494 [Piccolia ochrophora]